MREREIDAWRDLLPAERACEYVWAGFDTLTDARHLEAQRAAGVPVDRILAVVRVLRHA